MKNRLYIVCLIILVNANYLNAQDKKFSPDLSGMIIGWTNMNFNDGFTNQSGLRYIPELSLGYPLNDSWKLDARASANIFGYETYNENEFSFDGKIKPYRLWIRLSSDRFILRTGLQKLNFGSASLLRPLMWFDQIDPRDPLQLTDGVYGVLTRYYFLNNANIWFWILYGNGERRGWDVFPSDPETPEYGGRFQFPLGPGEMALSYHHRTMDAGMMILPQNGRTIYYDPFKQDRFAIDGKWDVGVGIWLENSFKRNRERIIPGQRFTNQLSLGIDYTFGIGNGLNTTLEHLLHTGSEEFLKNTQNVNYTALSLNYPIGLMDRVSAIFYFNPESQNFYRIFNWSRQYDNLTLYLLAYWNPEAFDLYQNMEAGNLFSGKGFQLMISLNH